MDARRRPIERTRKYDVWAEQRSQAVGPYELVLQVIDDLAANDGEYLIRASYRRDGVMRPSQPTFGANRWVEVLTGAMSDPEFFTDEQVAQLRTACEARLGK